MYKSKMLVSFYSSCCPDKALYRTPDSHHQVGHWEVDQVEVHCGPESRKVLFKTQKSFSSWNQNSSMRKFWQQLRSDLLEIKNKIIIIYE